MMIRKKGKQNFERKLRIVLPVLFLIGTGLLILSLIAPVNAQGVICPGNIATEGARLGYQCSQTKDPQICRQYDIFSYCVAKCYPNCYITAPSNFNPAGVSCSCDSGGPSTPDSPSVPPTEEPDLTWVVVVGVLGVAGVGAAVVLKGRGPGAKAEPAKQEKKEEKDKKKSPVKYILQVSPSDKITVSPKEKGAFTATAWKVDEQGVPHRADNASITVVSPANIAGLRVIPTSGMGSVSVSVSLEKPAGVQSARLQVNATAEGKSISTFITVNFEAESNIEFD